MRVQWGTSGRRNTYGEARGLEAPVVAMRPKVPGNNLADSVSGDSYWEGLIFTAA